MKTWDGILNNWVFPSEMQYPSDTWQILSCRVDKSRFWNLWHLVIKGEKIQFSVNVKGNNPCTTASLRYENGI